MDDTLKIKENYRELVLKHGDSVESCQYSDQMSQHERFSQMIQVGDLNGAKILDLGCGIGDLYKFLIEKKISMDYTGIDIVEEMIEIAQKKYDNIKFKTLNILEEELNEKYDYVIMNGIFNNNFGDVDSYMKKLLTKSFDLCNKGIAFNFVSTYVNFKVDKMAYHSPEEIFEFCVKNLSRKTNLAHHYFKCDVACYVYR